MTGLNYTFQFNVILSRLPELLQGALLSLELALAGFWLGAPLALLLAATRNSGPTWAQRLAGAYVTFLTKWDPLESTCRHASLSIL